MKGSNKQPFIMSIETIRIIITKNIMNLTTLYLKYGYIFQFTINGNPKKRISETFQYTYFDFDEIMRVC